MAKVINRPESKTADPRVLFQTMVYLMPQQSFYNRSVYGLRNLAAEVGGILTSLTLLAGALIAKLSKHQFYLNIMKQLFFVNSKDPNFVKQLDKDVGNNSRKLQKRLKHMPGYRGKYELQNNKGFQEKIKEHRVIQINLKDQALMLLNMYLPCLKLVCRCKPMSSYFQLFAKGKKKIDKELNVVRLIKNVNAI